MTEYETIEVKDNFAIRTTKDAPICCGQRMIIEHAHYNSGLQANAFLHFYCPECFNKECKWTEEYENAVKQSSNEK